MVGSNSLTQYNMGCQTFSMCNIAPQTGWFNRNNWLQLEKAEQKAVPGNNMVVINGSVVRPTLSEDDVCMCQVDEPANDQTLDPYATAITVASQGAALWKPGGLSPYSRNSLHRKKCRAKGPLLGGKAGYAYTNSCTGEPQKIEYKDVCPKNIAVPDAFFKLIINMDSSFQNPLRAWLFVSPQETDDLDNPITSCGTPFCSDIKRGKTKEEALVNTEVGLSNLENHMDLKFPDSLRNAIIGSTMAQLDAMTKSVPPPQTSHFGNGGPSSSLVPPGLSGVTIALLVLVVLVFIALLLFLFLKKRRGRK